MNDCGYLLMSIGEVRGYSVFCTLVDLETAISVQRGSEAGAKQASEVELTWAKVVLAGLRRPLTVISSKSTLDWWLHLPLGEWAFFPMFHVPEYLPGIERTAFLPCSKWLENGPVSFQEVDFPELTPAMWDWMAESLFIEFKTYDSQLFDTLLKSRLALVARRLRH